MAAQVRFVGNSVSPPPMRALIESLFAEELQAAIPLEQIA